MQFLDLHVKFWGKWRQSFENVCKQLKKTVHFIHFTFIIVFFPLNKYIGVNSDSVNASSCVMVSKFLPL